MDADDWQFLAEGNANVVFRHTGSTHQNKVLRVRKSSASSSQAYRTLEHYDYLKHVVLPLLEPIHDSVLVGELLDVDKMFLKSLDSKLIASEKDRALAFRYSRIECTECHALLLPSLESSQAMTCLEFKPKWLVQSPNAPPNATRCRTCALRNKRSLGAQVMNARFCPLDLASGSRIRLLRAVHALNEERSWFVHDSVLDSIVDHFLATPVIVSLKNAQMNSLGNMQLLMTLRDCSIFIQVNLAARQVVKLWLSDLDRKSSSKAKAWEEVEMQLSTEGWYAGRNDAAAEDGTVCLV